MLTLEKLKLIKPGSVFATGTFIDNELGLYMTGSGKELRWIAVKGNGWDDWCIYCHFATHNIGWIKDHGDKVCSVRNIKMCMPCTDETFALYRY